MTAPAMYTVPPTEIYGRGWAFPFQFDPKTGGVKQARGLDLLTQDIAFLLGTYVGELIMVPTFGSHINEMLFQMNRQEQYATLSHFVSEALEQEPRVQKMTGCTVSQNSVNPQAIDVTISYLPIQQTTPSNLVLPLQPGA